MAEAPADIASAVAAAISLDFGKGLYMAKEKGTHGWRTLVVSIALLGRIALLRIAAAITVRMATGQLKSRTSGVFHRFDG